MSTIEPLLLSKAFRGAEDTLFPLTQKSGNFMYGNYLFLLDDLSDDKTYSAVADLTRFVSDPANSDQTLNILINSGGGNVMLMNTLIGLMNTAKLAGMEVRTYVLGMAGSAASVIAIQGTYRLMSRNAIHFVHFGTIPQFLTKHTEIVKSSNFASKLQHQAVEAYLKFCPNLTQEMYLQITEDEMGYLFSDDCLKYGLCDGIIEDDLDKMEAEERDMALCHAKAIELFEKKKEQKTKKRVHKEQKPKSKKK
jgi:ATP-dependent protease ClpP protease subunit